MAHSLGPILRARGQKCQQFEVLDLQVDRRVGNDGHYRSSCDLPDSVFAIARHNRSSSPKDSAEGPCDKVVQGKVLAGIQGCAIQWHSL